MASSDAPRAPPCAPPAAQQASAAQAAPLPDFHLLLEYSDNVFCILDMDGTALYVSPNVARVFDAAPDALVGCVACGGA
jgi:PAS domain-containing protein